MKKQDPSLSTIYIDPESDSLASEVPTKQLEPEQAEPVIQIQGLTKSFREGLETRSVLDSLTATIEIGEFVAIQGKSGSGKSTLLNLISGIDIPDAGTVWIDGTDLTQLSERERTLFRRRKIGIVFQFFNLIPTLSVWENISLPLELNGRVAPADWQRAHNLLERVGLADRQNAYPDRLSGGEQQRVAIARALANNAPLILADEPTGNLDAATSEAILALLESLTRQAGKTLVMVTHSRSAAANADRLLTLQNGKLAELPVSK